MQYDRSVIKQADFLSRLLTSNPYTAEGKNILNGLNVELTTKQFFDEKLYAEPFFLEKQTVTTNSTEDFDEDDTSDSEDYIFICDDNSNLKNSMLKQYENFKNSFNNLNELPLLFIRGGSGTGKSTYMYSLIHELKKLNSNVLHIELTLEEYSDSSSYYGVNLPETLDNTISRFTRIVLKKIFSIMDCEIKNAIESKNYNRIRDAYACYKKSFRNCPSEKQAIINVFNVFYNLTFQKLDRVAYNKRVAKECVKIYLGSSDTTILSNLLLLLIELSYCLNCNKFNLISFDGIEYLIKRTYHIYDVDINNIIMTFEEVKNCAENLFEECNLKFADCFKIVLAIRNATLDYCNQREQENIRDSNISVDVTNWYRTEEIYKARTKYFSEHNLISDRENFDKIRDIVNVIINDSKKGKKRASGAMDMLERMYNFDKRSLQSNLLAAVSQIVINSKNGIIKDKFIELYNDIGPMVYNTNVKGRRYRYLCRRAIIRILLDQIERENRETFFDGIYFSEWGEECMQSSYMRKMLIFLMHNQVVDNKIIDNYVSFESVIKAVARTDSSSIITDTALEEIATLIYRLSDFRLHDSAWQQLISIKFHYPDHQLLSNEQQFVTKIKELFKNGKLSSSDFGIRLNYAGAFLAYIQSDYEFFACRCKDFKIPLIFTNDVNYILSLLDAVHAKAVECIKMVIPNEKKMFGKYKDMHLPDKKYLYKDYVYNPEVRLIPHPKRIINNHIVYLEHYRCFVENVDDIIFPADKPVI